MMHIEAYPPYAPCSMNMNMSSGVDVVDGMAYGNPYRQAWRCAAPTANGLSALDDQLLARAELANEITKTGVHPFFRQQSPAGSLYVGTSPHSAATTPGLRPAHQMSQHLYASISDHPHSMPCPPDTPGAQTNSTNPASFDSLQQHMQHIQPIPSSSAEIQRSLQASYPGGYSAYSAAAAATAAANSAHHHHHHHQGSHNLSPQYSLTNAHHLAQEMDYDPRELEAFAERFKQRRIKLGVTQADVGKALGNLKLTGVGSLSQSTICRFESLTLSHNNMVALKPILQAWLEEAELQAAEAMKNPEYYGDAADKKRKRTSITDAEKRSLEAYFAVQPRPSSEKIAQIADKLNLKKNVVRVWFCNQRQKQKRMKFSSVGMNHHGQNL